MTAELGVPFEETWNILRSMFEVPARYTGERILTRVIGRGDDWLRREICWPDDDARTQVQRLSWRQDGEVFVIDESVEGPGGGVAKLALTRGVRGSRIAASNERSDRSSIAGQPKTSSIEAIARRIETVAARRASIPDWVATFFAVLDSMDAVAFANQFHHDADFHFGASLALYGRDAIHDHTPIVFESLQGLSHHLVAAVIDGDRAGVECLTSYHRRADGCWLTLPAGVFLTRKDGKVSSINICADSSLLHTALPD